MQRISINCTQSVPNYSTLFVWKHPKPLQYEFCLFRPSASNCCSDPSSIGKQSNSICNLDGILLICSMNITFISLKFISCSIEQHYIESIVGNFMECFSKYARYQSDTKYMAFKCLEQIQMPVLVNEIINEIEPASSSCAFQMDRACMRSCHSRCPLTIWPFCLTLPHIAPSKNVPYI